MARTYFKEMCLTIIPSVALRWTHQGKRKQGRPKDTLRRKVEKEIKTMGLTWDEEVMAALDRIGWRPHAPCGAKTKKKKKNLYNRVTYFRSDSFVSITFFIM